MACKNGAFGIAQFLIQHGADIDLQSKDGFCPLYAASLNGHVDIVRMLLSMGAQTSLTTSTGW